MRRAIVFTLAAASLATASVAAVSLAAAAPAGKATDQTSIRVSFADLNLASRSGARTLVSRIRVAANELCGADLAGDLDRMAERARCVRATQDRAIRAVDRPTVTAAYLGLPQPDAVALTGAAR